MVRRLVSNTLAVLVVLATTEQRLTDGGRAAGEYRPAPHWTLASPRSGSAAGVVHATGPSNCPLVVSLNPASPFIFTSVDQGVRFDIDGDSDPDRVAWTERASDVAFLALDRNADGAITSGQELISNRTLAGVRDAPHVLVRLAADAAGGGRRGALDARNPLYFKLSLWADANHDGISQPVELQPAHRALAQVGLGFQRHHLNDRHGNRIRHRGFVHVRTAGERDEIRSAEDEATRRRWMYEVCLASR